MRALHPILFPPRWIRLAALLAFVAVAVSLFWQGAQPHAVGLVSEPWDKLAHLVLFGGFGASAWVVLGGGRHTADLLAPMAAAAIGVLDELAQSTNPGRTAGLDDLAADAFGALLAVAILAALRERARGTARLATPPPGPDISRDSARSRAD